MIESKNKYIYIDTYLQKTKKFVPTGVITFNDNDFSCFTYFDKYMEANNPSINPSSLNWKEGNTKHFVVNPKNNKEMLNKTFWEMIPSEDDWGHVVLSKRYPEYEYFNNVQKLHFLQKRVVGGLNAYVNEQSKEENIVGVDWLEQIRDESIDFYLQRIPKITHIKAINPLSSYGGVRPKCMFEDDEGDFWIAKFNLPTDEYDMAIAEQVSMDMARDCGLTCAESKVIKLPSGENVFLSKRFDRHKEQMYHSLSLFSLVENSKNIEKTGKFIQNLINQYSDFENQDSLDFVIKTLLDIGINNTDNHLRNIRLILNENDKWQLSPFYDINFSTLNSNYVYNPIALENHDTYLANPNIIELFSETYGIDSDIIEENIVNIFSVLENWEFYCKKYGMSESDMLKIGHAITTGLYRRNIRNKTKMSNNLKSRNIPKLIPKNK